MQPALAFDISRPRGLDAGPRRPATANLKAPARAAFRRLTAADRLSPPPRYPVEELTPARPEDANDAVAAPLADGNRAAHKFEEVTGYLGKEIPTDRICQDAACDHAGEVVTVSDRSITLPASGACAQLRRLRASSVLAVALAGRAGRPATLGTSIRPRCSTHRGPLHHKEIQLAAELPPRRARAPACRPTAQSRRHPASGPPDPCSRTLIPHGQGICKRFSRLGRQKYPRAGDTIWGAPSYVSMAFLPHSPLIPPTRASAGRPAVAAPSRPGAYCGCNSFLLRRRCCLRRSRMAECICETRDSESASVSPISFMVISSK